MSSLLPPDLQAQIDEWERRDALPPTEKYPWLSKLSNTPIAEPITMQYTKENQ